MLGTTTVASGQAQGKRNPFLHSQLHYVILHCTL